MNPDWPVVIHQIVAQTECEIKDVAAHCGCSVGTVRQWVQRVRTPSFPLGWELLNAYVEKVGPRIPQYHDRKDHRRCPAANAAGR